MFKAIGKLIDGLFGLLLLPFKLIGWITLAIFIICLVSCVL